MLLVKIRRFCDRTRMRPTTFGRLAAHDPRLVADLRRGRELGPAMINRLERFMTEYSA